MYVQNVSVCTATRAHVLKLMCACCPSTRRRFERTRGRFGRTHREEGGCHRQLQSSNDILHGGLDCVQIPGFASTSLETLATLPTSSLATVRPQRGGTLWPLQFCMTAPQNAHSSCGIFHATDVVFTFARGIVVAHNGDVFNHDQEFGNGTAQNAANVQSQSWFQKQGACHDELMPTSESSEDAKHRDDGCSASWKKFLGNMKQSPPTPQNHTCVFVHATSSSCYP